MLWRMQLHWLTLNNRHVFGVSTPSRIIMTLDKKYALFCAENQRRNYDYSTADIDRLVKAIAGAEALVDPQQFTDTLIVSTLSGFIALCGQTLIYLLLFHSRHRSSRLSIEPVARQHDAMQKQQQLQLGAGTRQQHTMSDEMLTGRRPRQLRGRLHCRTARHARSRARRRWSGTQRRS